MTILKTRLHNLVSSKFEDLNYFYGRQLYANIAPSVFIAGGAILSTMRGEKVNDLDFFFTNTAAATTMFNGLPSISDTATRGLALSFEVDPVNPRLQRGVLSSTMTGKTVAQVITENNRKLKKAKRKTMLNIAYISHNAVTMSNGVQFIFRFIGEPEEVFSTFDYEHCKVYSRLDAVSPIEPVFTGRSQESIATNELVFSGNSRFILSAILRMNKFANRGWMVPSTVALGLMASAVEVDWSSLDVIREELAGIYGMTPAQVESIVVALSKKERFSLKEVVALVEEV